MFNHLLDEHLKCFKDLSRIRDTIRTCGQHLAGTLANGNKILICGNGGSAADAQHFAAEIIGRFRKNRSPWPALALTTDTSALTAIANDFSFDDVFARQVEGLGAPGDALIAISTSGNSKNVIGAVRKSTELGLTAIGLLGRDGGTLKSMVDPAVLVPSGTTARIQEMHLFILHAWAEMIETSLTDGKRP